MSIAQLKMKLLRENDPQKALEIAAMIKNLENGSAAVSEAKPSPPPPPKEIIEKPVESVPEITVEEDESQYFHFDEFTDDKSGRVVDSKRRAEILRGKISDLKDERKAIEDGGRLLEEANRVKEIDRLLQSYRGYAAIFVRGFSVE